MLIVSADSRSLVLDASAVVRLICHDLVAESWAAQLGQASMVLAPELTLADARDLVDQFEPDLALQAEALALAASASIRAATTAWH